MHSSLSTSSSLPPAPAAAAAAAASDVQPVELHSVIGFNGIIRNGFILHPNDEHLIYALGATVVIRHLHTNQQSFLTNPKTADTTINTLALSSSGKFLATGNVTAAAGYIATITIWDMESFSVVHQLSLHKGSVVALAFSPDEQYLASLGGKDDNRLIVWSAADGIAIAGSTAANDSTTLVQWSGDATGTVRALVTAGHYNLRYWQFNSETRRVTPQDAALGQMKRVFTSLCMSATHVYAGSQSGDILEVALPAANNNATFVLKRHGPTGKKAFALGVTALTLSKKGNLIVGSGDGIVGVVKTAEKELTVSKTNNTLVGGITSIRLNAAGDHVFLATNECNIYCTQVQSLTTELRFSSHKQGVSSIAFPSGYGEVFATASGCEIRVWQTKTTFELLRINVPNVLITSVVFSVDGKRIISGWNDGCIRIFGPQSGKLLSTITDANPGGVTCITTFHHDNSRIISGGEQGHVRVWQLGSTPTSGATMLHTLKEHKQRVNTLRVAPDDTEVVSASNDGSCIVWESQRFTRKLALVSSTQFTAAVYHPSSVQLVTAAVDRKLTYWDVSDGQPIRVIDSAHNDSITSIEVSSHQQYGDWLFTVGNDHQLKVWSYDEGRCYYSGSGNTGNINAVAISPDQQNIVSVGSDGAIFVYLNPAVAASQQGTQQLSPTAASHEQENIIANMSHLSMSAKLNNGSNGHTAAKITNAPVPTATTHRTRAVLR